MASVPGIEVADERGPTLVAAATFDQMRDRADELAPEVRVDGFWNDNRRFFHRGTNGQWQSSSAPGAPGCLSRKAGSAARSRRLRPPRAA